MDFEKYADLLTQKLIEQAARRNETRVLTQTDKRVIEDFLFRFWQEIQLKRDD